jgi:hypothetical protein
MLNVDAHRLDRHDAKALGTLAADVDAVYAGDAADRELIERRASTAWLPVARGSAALGEQYRLTDWPERRRRGRSGHAHAG